MVDVECLGGGGEAESGGGAESETGGVGVVVPFPLGAEGGAGESVACVEGGDGGGGEEVGVGGSEGTVHELWSVLETGLGMHRKRGGTHCDCGETIRSPGNWRDNRDPTTRIRVEKASVRPSTIRKVNEGSLMRSVSAWNRVRDTLDKDFQRVRPPWRRGLDHPGPVRGLGEEDIVRSIAFVHPCALEVAWWCRRSEDELGADFGGEVCVHLSDPGGATVAV